MLVVWTGTDATLPLSPSMGPVSPWQLSLVSVLVNASLSMPLYYNECIMRLKLYWKSNLPFWALLVLILVLFFFFFFFAASSWNLKIARLCPSLCNLMDCSPPGSSVHGILQARILEEVVIPFSRGSSQTRDQTWVSCIAGKFFTVWATREAQNQGSPET